MSKEEREELNIKACKLIQSVDTSFPVGDLYDFLREKGVAGYANVYLLRCWNESELKNKADVKTFKQLLVIDGKLGTTQAEQLFHCVLYPDRMDLIKV